ncbi:MAG: hypothetical protein ACO1RX_09870 [Candidatus Sericytochromatia bacterium]
MPASEPLVRFCCPLKSVWPAEVPTVLRPEVPPELWAYFELNPHIHWVWPDDGCAPGGWEERMAGIAFAADLPVCWVEHPLYAYPEAYWPDAEMRHWIRRLQTGQDKPQSLPATVFQILAAAHILLPQQAYATDRAKRDQKMRSALRSERCTLLPGVISPLQIAALRHYADRLQSHVPLHHEHTLITQRDYHYDNPVMRYFHHQFPRYLERLTGEKLRPSYNLISYYPPQSVLHLHVDRSPCIWNLSVSLAHQPEVWGDARWPLDIWIEDQKRSVRLNPGDGFLYRGREHLHGRPPLPADHSETVLLFHFVDAAYGGDLA